MLSISSIAAARARMTDGAGTTFLVAVRLCCSASGPTCSSPYDAASVRAVALLSRSREARNPLVVVGLQCRRVEEDPSYPAYAPHLGVEAR